MDFTGTSGDDELVGTSGDDRFNVTQGGNDFVRGLEGNDTFTFDDTFTPDDRVKGALGTDTLNLAGDYDLRITADTLSGVEVIHLEDGFSYRLVLKDSVVAADTTMTILGVDLTGDNALVVNGIFETDGRFNIGGGEGDDAIGTGDGDDAIETQGGDDIVDPGHGRDAVAVGDGDNTIVYQFGGFGASDTIDAGDGFDQLLLAGNYSVTFKKFTIQGVESIGLNGGSDYSLTLGNASLPDDVFFTVDGSSLGADDTLFVDGSGARHYLGYSFAGGAGADVLIGSGSGDYFFGNGGADEMTGGGGPDVFFHQHVFHSTGRAFDTVVGFDAHHDGFDPGFTVSAGNVAGFDGKVSGGRLSSASFNHDLENAIGAGELAVDHAVLYQPKHGDFADALFLIVEGNGEAGYQANDDLVVRLVDAVHMKDFSADNFGNVA